MSNGPSKVQPGVVASISSTSGRLLNVQHSASASLVDISYTAPTNLNLSEEHVRSVFVCPVQGRVVLSFSNMILVGGKLCFVEEQKYDKKIILSIWYPYSIQYFFSYCIYCTTKKIRFDKQKKKKKQPSNLI